MTKVSKLVYWAPRILSILLLLFLAMFSLDVFEPGLSAGQIVLGLFMHNIPVLILTAVLIISWKREIVGAIAFALGGILYIILLLMSKFEWFMIAWALQISGIAFLIAYLFLLNWRRKKRISK